jgi:hypothetical protein
MKLNVSAAALTFGLVWAVAVLLVAIGNAIWPSYGGAFLDVVGSIYPGYHPGTGGGSIVSGTLYAFVDGLIGGAVLAWLYNRFAGRSAPTTG